MDETNGLAAVVDDQLEPYLRRYGLLGAGDWKMCLDLSCSWMFGLIIWCMFC